MRGTSWRANGARAGGELARFLKANPDITQVDAFLADMNGVPRGKRFPVHEAKKIWDSGVQLPFCLYFLDVTGEDLDPGGRSEARGDPDGDAWPVAGTLARVPWASEPTAQVLLTMPEQKNQPCLVDPRQVLARLLARFAKRGLKPVVAVELEFYLMDRKRGPLGEPLPPISPATGEPDAARQLYSIGGLDIYADFVRDVAAAATQQHVPASTAIAENSPGQFEINLYHDADAVRACDHAVLLRRIIKSVAPKHGFSASFMAKPYLDRAGSGMHVHCSLVDAKGRNAFDDGGEKGTALLRHAIGGLAATTAEAMALLAPNLNSYRRYRSGSLVPMGATWGYNNRSVAFRVPDGIAQGAPHRAPHRRRRRQSVSRGRRDPGGHAARHRAQARPRRAGDDRRQRQGRSPHAVPLARGDRQAAQGEDPAGLSLRRLPRALRRRQSGGAGQVQQRDLAAGA